MHSHNKEVIVFCHKHKRPDQTNRRALDSGIGIGRDFGCLEKKVFLCNLLFLVSKKAFLGLFYSKAHDLFFCCHGNDGA